MQRGFLSKEVLRELNDRLAEITCEGDRTKWWIGGNLFSSWKRESEGDWIANAMRLADFREVEPLCPGCRELLEGDHVACYDALLECMGT